MATIFLEPGGDATFNVTNSAGGGLWGKIGNGPAVATDFVHGGHVKSIKYRPSQNDSVETPAATLADAGRRLSIWIYMNVLPNATASIIDLHTNFATTDTTTASVRITSAGVLQLWNGISTAQIGSNGSTLSTGTWYRISLAYTISSTTVNRFELFKDGVSDISVTNATLTTIGTNHLNIGNFNINTTLDLRTSDHYLDNLTNLADPGNIWVTAKRPNANGTANNFGTQIGSGGSGYGSGHSPQVNERPLSATNGWSVAAVAATTEEYNIESSSTGDINISTATIVDYTGWLFAKALTAETGQIVLNNVTSNISLTTSSVMFTKIAGSTTYPAGTGTDIGIITSATVTTVSLYECGIVVAYIPAVVASSVQFITYRPPWRS